MTSQYDSRESAIEMGLYYAGFGDEALRKRAMDELPEAVQTQLGFPQNKTIDTYTVRTPAGKDVQIGVGKFREGFDLWLIDPESGFSQKA
ncbi:MAG: hypothetical protein KKF46_07595 [Nanoarchaeota archaeon]|nr:hypothetical protein [Nanoarchaeota archaeon]MBU1322191.1 hypothetical protein [Nanoarchaeota archaeon]MBU1597732.1 hypothetical protein [Nanoarchaeota archaeon]MBU2442114.1 hypothetical protein [Nanoarchaeota archaeon]